MLEYRIVSESLTIMIAFMPVPLAFVMDGEGHFNMAKKYFLNFGAVCLQGLMIIGCIGMWSRLVPAIISWNMFDLGSILCGHSECVDAGHCILSSALTGITAPFSIVAALLLSSLVLILAMLKCGQWSKQLLNV